MLCVSPISANRVRSAFTLVELLSTIAILAILVVSALVFIPSYISWAKQTSDARTLLVLNDAINRYKTEGGGITGLTYGSQISNILTRMKSVITYGGRGHQVMENATTYPARSIAATGSGARYHFTRFNTSQLADYVSGDETGNGGGVTHGTQSFTSVGSTTWTVPAGVTTVEVLIVAGGGGGGGGFGFAGGAGAGGLIHNSSYSVTPGNPVTVTVGGGGAGGSGPGDGTNGSNSVFDSLTAVGGGAGAYLSDGHAGGSGGGGGGSGSGGSATGGQGNAGGAGLPEDDYAGGGGGGAGTVGADATDDVGGNGGDGLQFSISGSPTYYAGGGGGNSDSNGTGGLGGGGNGGTSTGTTGSAHTGSGGGGGGTTGGAGGSGIVIVKY